MLPLTPQHVVRRLLPKPWGGARLGELLGSELPDEPIGESWELFDRPDGSSTFREGGSLREWMERDPEALLGRGVAATPDGRFPLLLKFLDAREALSIQVHPGAEQAREHGDGPKNEAWVVMAAGPRARIGRGFRPGTSEAEVEAALGSRSLLDLLDAFTPAAGDVVSIPAGVVHALGPDVVVFEVQQNSDVTYRLFDPSGRELHLAEGRRALVVADTGPQTVPRQRIDERAEWLVRTRDFRVRRMRFDTQATLATESGFKVMTILSGLGTLGWRSGGRDLPLQLQKGDTVLIPACTEVVFVSPISPMETFWTDAGGR